MSGYGTEDGYKITEKIEAAEFRLQSIVDSVEKKLNHAITALEAMGKPKGASSSGWIEISENERIKAGELRVELLLGKVPDTAGLLIDAKVMAELLSISSRTLYRLDDMQAIPQPVRLGRLIRWRLAEVIAWIDSGCPQRRSWTYPPVETKKRR